MGFVVPLLHDVIDSILYLEDTVEISLSPFYGGFPGVFRNALKLFSQYVQSRREDGNGSTIVGAQDKGGR